MPHFFASNLRAVVLPARTKNFEFIFEAKSVRDESAIIFAKSLAKSLHGGQKILLSKQKKGARFLVKFNKHFSTHSKEIIKSALKEYAELVGAEIVAHNLSENKIRVDSVYMLDWRGICALLGGNSVLGMQFRTCGNFQASTDSSLVESPKISTNTKATPQSLPLRFCESQNLGENSDKIAESKLDSANPTTNAESTNKSQQTIEGIAVEVVGFLGDFGCETGLKSAKHSKSPKSTQDAPKSKLSTQDEFAFLEIGFGSGRHILHLAQKHPSAQIIGLEIYRPAISQVLRQIEILGLQNLYVASIDARVLCEVLPAKCLDRIYLHFPVPWDKNPQRRVLSAQFLGNAMRALKDDGFFELLTDSAEYFAFAKALAKGYKFKAEEGAEGEVVSKYEARWRRQEKVIYKLCIYPACGNSSLDFGNSVLGMQFRTCEKSQNNSSLRADSQNLRGKTSECEVSCNPFCERIAESTESNLDSAPPSPLFSLDSFSQKGCTPRPAPPTRQKLPLFAFRGRASLSPLLAKNRHSHYCSLESDFLHHEAGEFSGASHNSFLLDSADFTPFSPTKICKKEYFLHIKNKYIFEGGVVLFASFGAYYAPSSAYFVICGNEVSTISEIIPTRANIDALGLFMELCFDN